VPPPAPKPRPQAIPESDSHVAMPAARSQQTRRITGVFEEESTALNSPAIAKKGNRSIPAAAVGMRANTEKIAPAKNAKVTEHRAQVKEKLKDEKDERKQKVWDKLDNAKRQATQKLDRIKTGFEPKGEPNKS
jgi:hypothetical protein